MADNVFLDQAEVVQRIIVTYAYIARSVSIRSPGSGDVAPATSTTISKRACPILNMRCLGSRTFAFSLACSACPIRSIKTCTSHIHALNQQQRQWEIYNTHMYVRLYIISYTDVLCSPCHGTSQRTLGHGLRKLVVREGFAVVQPVDQCIGITIEVGTAIRHCWYFLQRVHLYAVCRLRLLYTVSGPRSFNFFPCVLPGHSNCVLSAGNPINAHCTLAAAHTVGNVVIPLCSLHQRRIHGAVLSTPCEALPTNMQKASSPTGQPGTHRAVLALFAFPPAKGICEAEIRQFVLMLFVPRSSVLWSRHRFSGLVSVVWQLLFLFFLRRVRPFFWRVSAKGTLHSRS